VDLDGTALGYNGRAWSFPYGIDPKEAGSPPYPVRRRHSASRWTRTTALSPMTGTRVEAGQDRFERIPLGLRILRVSDILRRGGLGRFAVTYNGTSWSPRYIDGEQAEQAWTPCRAPR